MEMDLKRQMAELDLVITFCDAATIGAEKHVGGPPN